MTQIEAKRKIQELIAKYEQVKLSGRIRNYSEEDTKKDFISPMFSALGWNMEDRNEVTAEEYIRNTDRIDYGFYLGGQPKFFLEAKKLGEDLHKELHANQAIRYSFNKAVTWAVLTDFEGLKVFNANAISKYLGDKLYFELRYDQYIDSFDKLWQLSRESFSGGLIDQKAREGGKLLQKVSVTDQLAKDLNDARDTLTHYLHQWNEKVPANLLDEGVQKLLDRLIFLRVAEDKGIETPILRQLIRDYENRTNLAQNIFESMIKKFRELNAIYNSGLFDEHPFEKWVEGSGKTKEVIELLYGKKGYYEYDFKFIPADVLGNVYENYLGHLLNKSKKGITLDKSAKKRKEQGIYYTPSYIEDYIVEHALKPVLDKCSSVAQLKAIKVLDPACGSGSFLIKAMDMILKKYKSIGGRMLDESNLKIRILLENIYGVDLDEKAVEIARLNLLINSLDSRMKLPDLDKHIKNGNSLVTGTDEELKKYFGKSYRDKKPFNWKEEFPEVFNRLNPGFDVIIGNPPYIKEFVNKSAFDGLRDSPYYQGKMDLWTLFACKGIDLLRSNGVLSFIAPNNWVTNAGASITREKVLAETQILEYIDFGGYQVFENAGIQTMIFAIQKKKPSKQYKVKYLTFSQDKHTENEVIAKMSNFTQSVEFKPDDMKLGIEFSSGSNSEVGELLAKIVVKKNFELTEGEVAQGIVGAPDDAFFVKEDDYKQATVSEKRLLRKFFTNTQRYHHGSTKGYIYYSTKKNCPEITQGEYPNFSNSISNFREKLSNRREVKSGQIKLHHLQWPRNEKYFISGSKIIAAIRTYKPAFYFTKDDYYGSRALNFIQSDRIDLRYLTGILNSKLVEFWLKHKGKKLGNLLQIDKGPLLQIPIYLSDSSVDRKSLIKLVEEITLLNKSVNSVSENSNKWNELNKVIEKTDKQINQLVYKLYGLTEDEIKTVEGGK